jgi:sugar lactone lactonase YvrE
VRKAFAVLGSLVFALVLSACGSDSDNDGDDAPDASVGIDSGADEPDAAPADAASGFEQPPLGAGLSTLAGTATAGALDGDRNHALFNNPVNVVVDGHGQIIVADFDNSLIRLVTQDGHVSTISETPSAGVFARPFGLALAGDWLYIETDGNSMGQTHGAGAALWRMPVEGGPTELVRDTFGRARGLVALRDGRLAATFYQEHVVQLYDPSSNTWTPLAGLASTPGSEDGSGASALFNLPYDLLQLDDDSLLVADQGNHRLRRVDLDGNVTSYAGTGLPGSDDGPLAAATFNAPQALAQDPAGNVYVTDTGSYLVRHISPEGQVTTIAGDGSPGHGDSDEPRSGQLYGLEGLDVGSDGYLYVADGTRGQDVPYHRVRRISLP